MDKEKLILWMGFFGYFGVMTILMREWGWEALWWLIGGLLGMSFVFIDRLIYVFVTNPHEHLSVHVKHLMKKGRYVDGVRLLKARKNEQRELTARSVFFMGAWIPAALFVVTSTASMMAIGIVMGIGLHILLDIWRDWRDMNRLKTWMFWPIKRTVKDGEARAVVGIFMVFFLGMTMALI